MYKFKTKKIIKSIDVDKIFKKIRKKKKLYIVTAFLT